MLDATFRWPQPTATPSAPGVREVVKEVQVVVLKEVVKELVAEVPRFVYVNIVLAEEEIVLQR